MELMDQSGKTPGKGKNFLEGGERIFCYKEDSQLEAKGGWCRLAAAGFCFYGDG